LDREQLTEIGWLGRLKWVVSRGLSINVNHVKRSRAAYWIPKFGQTIM